MIVGCRRGLGTLKKAVESKGFKEKEVERGGGWGLS